MNVLLFGGSFNPPHLGHAIVIDQAFELIPELDELWLLPAFNHTFGKELAPAADRLAMCQTLVSDKVKICSIELDKKPSGSTHETLQLLQQEYPDHTFSFLMGSDQLPTFDKWINYQKLLQEMHFYVYPRGSHRHDVTFPNMELLESPTQVITNISSTLAKHRLAQHMSVSRVLDPIVAKYIQNNQLYV